VSAPDRPAPVLTEHPHGVLLVDDQAIIGEAVRRMLEGEADLRYRYCPDPTTALEAAKAFAPTVILSDLVMPQMDGLDLVRAFRTDEATRKIPLIVLSSREDAATKAESFALGANDYLVKLPDRLELVARVRYHSDAYIHLLQRDEAFEALAHSQRIMQADLEQAARYVRSLLPEPRDGRVVARWEFIPSADLGGDTFGYHWIDEDHFVLYLLDVSGHGVGAALLSVSVLNLLRSQALEGTDLRDPGQVLTRLNDTFMMEQQGGKYFTIWYAVYRPSSREIRYAGGGHPAALLFEPGAAAPVPLPSSGPMPGAVPGLHFHADRRNVPAGARLLVYSDGVYEIRRPDGTMSTFQELVEALCGPVGPPPLERALRRAERLRSGSGFDDDVSLLEVEFR
jgi:sigma-B regulation protein RsbU (phosphoserine phosphatase)